MSKLTNIEKFAINGMLAENKTIDEMVKVIKKPKSTIESYVGKLASELVEEEKQPKKKRKPSLFITKTAKKKVGGVSVMTPAASARGDDFLKNIKPKTNDVSRRIFRPFGDSE